MKIIHYVFLCIKGNNIIVSDYKNNYYYSHSTLKIISQKDWLKIIQFKLHVMY